MCRYEWSPLLPLCSRQIPGLARWCSLSLSVSASETRSPLWRPLALCPPAIMSAQSTSSYSYQQY